MKTVIKLAVIGFCTALGAVVANRMSAEAMAVVIGVVCGVLASIPMAVLIMLLTNRSQQRQVENLAAAMQAQQGQPPVIIVGSAYPQLGPGSQPWPGSRPALGATEADFKILGDDETQS